MPLRLHLPGRDCRSDRAGIDAKLRGQDRDIRKSFGVLARVVLHVAVEVRPNRSHPAANHKNLRVQQLLHIRDRDPQNNRTLIAIFEPRPQTAGRQLCVA